MTTMPFSEFSPDDPPRDVRGAGNMSLPEHIYDLCEKGLLPAQFRVSDVRQALGNTYAETYIRRALGLYCEKPGNYTYRWNKPRFRKIRHGVYELVR